MADEPVEETIADISEELETLLAQLAILNGQTLNEFVTGLINDLKADYDARLDELSNQLYLLSELDDNGLTSFAEKLQEFEALINQFSDNDNVILTLTDTINNNKQFFDTKIIEMEHSISDLDNRITTIENTCSSTSTDGTAGTTTEECNQFVLDLETVKTQVNSNTAEITTLRTDVDSKLENIKITFENVSLSKIINALRTELTMTTLTDDEVDGIVF